MLGDSRARIGEAAGGDEDADGSKKDSWNLEYKVQAVVTPQDVRDRGF